MSRFLGPDLLTEPYWGQLSMHIPATEVRFHPLSFGDPNGRVFWWQGRLYRGIPEGKAGFYKEQFSKGIVQSLVARDLLVGTEVTDLTLDGYPLVLSHKTVPFVTYAPEWCGAALKAAALKVLDLQIALMREGLMLQDAHPWNVLFDGPKPVYVDVGSIVPISRGKGWAAHGEFLRFFLYPLVLMSEGHGRIARALLCDFNQGVLESEVTAICGCASGAHSFRGIGRKAKNAAKSLLPKWVQSVLREVRGAFRQRERLSEPCEVIASIDRIRTTVESIRLHRARTEWSNYYDDCFPQFTSTKEWTPKHNSMLQIVKDLRPRTMLDVGSNRGWFSQLASRNGTKVVATDVDEPAISQLYQDACASGQDILPLLLDCRNPTPGLGICNKELPPATERLRCDLVCALALLHHLVFKQSLRFEEIVKALSTFTHNWLLLEFISPEDRYVHEWCTARYSWYNLDALLNVIEADHTVEGVFASNLKTRRLVLCKKKRTG